MENEKLQPEETQHEPHAHANRRVIIGGLAVFILIAGILTWFLWGTEIKEACFGEEVCKVELPDNI